MEEMNENRERAGSDPSTPIQDLPGYVGNVDMNEVSDSEIDLEAERESQDGQVPNHSEEEEEEEEDGCMGLGEPRTYFSLEKSGERVEEPPAALSAQSRDYDDILDR
tara:strand:- start:828 stop:1148 length:321 start_codon:yes stop_codon:yes gene_type:complete